MACVRTIRNFSLRLSSFWRGLTTVACIVSLGAALAAPAAAAADPLATTVAVTVQDGYARLVFSAKEFIDASIRVAGNVLIISFKRPVNISVDRMPDRAPDYIGAARRDPDGMAIRMALAQHVTVNAIPANEKFFVDLLPDSWTAQPPSLPQDVIADMARRAHEADDLMRRQREFSQQTKVAPVHVHVATQPTFTRYIFDIADQTPVTAQRSKDRLVLSFDGALTFDLAEAQAGMPVGVTEISSELDDNSSLVRFVFGGKQDVRTFRDEKGYVVDVMNPDADASKAGQAAAALLQSVMPAVAPAAKPAVAAGGVPANVQAPPSMTAPQTRPSPVPQAAAVPPGAAPAAASATPPVVAVQSATPPATRASNPALAKGNAASALPPAAQAEPQPAMPAQIAATAQVSPPGHAASPAPVGSPAQASAPPPAAPPVSSAPAAQVAPAAPVAPAAQVAPATQVAPVAQVAPAAQVAPTVQAPAAQAAPAAQVAPAVQAVPAAPITPASPAVAKAAPPPSVAMSQPDSAVDAIKPAGAAHAGGKVSVELTRDGTNLKLAFPFAAPTAAAVFNRADALWLVFDAKTEFDLTALDGEPSHTIRGYDLTRTADAAVIRLKLDRPHLTSVATDGAVWTVQIGDTILEPTRSLDITRNVIGPNRSSVSVALDGPQMVHRFADSDVGDSLFVVTAFSPARGLINEQDFVEFRALPSTQGVVIEPIADDIDVELASDKIVVSRPEGLTLSASLQTLLHGDGSRPVMFDSQIWGFDREGSYMERQSHLLAAAAAAPETKRLAPRLDLARFYLARDMYPEAKGVLDVTLKSQPPATESVSAMVLRAIAEVMMNRPDDALKDLSDPAVGDQHDSSLWRALAYTRQGKWAQAREGFKTVEAAVATLPIELQRVALKDEMRSAIEVGDYDSATTELNDFQTIGVPHNMEPMIAVLMGRLDEGMGRDDDALVAYRTAADSWDRPAAAQGLLRETLLRYQVGDLKRDDVISQLESLTTIWRGDETEIEALKVLAHLYTEEGRYRDAFYVMRSAMAAHPDSAMTRQIQDEAAATFDSLFLTSKGDAMPAIDALALFYDFRELTPVGSRGDEMIRRLADRLVSVDLLDQAADLLQYQVDNRLEGAARAQVATRLAVIYLMNRKADRAQATLRSTRTADLSNDLRTQRLLLEARALSDLGRYDLALEVIGNINDRVAIRLRSDILWAARRWDLAAEQIELMYGDRYKDFRPLTEIERQDILRAEIGYALAEDALGLGRFREKYAAKMAETPDARAFDVVSSPLGSSSDQFGAIAHAAASADTLEGFLREMKARYPDSNPTPPPTQPSPLVKSPGASANGPSVSAQPAETNPAPAVLPAVPPAKASGRTAQL